MAVVVVVAVVVLAVVMLLLVLLLQLFQMECSCAWRAPPSCRPPVPP